MLGLVFMWSGLIVPWLTLFFMDGRILRRYLPAALAVSLLNTVTSQLAWHYQWWTIERPMFVWSSAIDFPLVYGAFLIGTIWILAFTFHKWWMFAIVNLAIDAFFSFVMPGVLRAMNLIDVRITGWQLYGILLFTAVLLYLFQLWYEGEGAEITIGRGSRAGGRA
ncbi:hypothetical protein [Paenibacillus methanolicus]|uniref:Uncharacterized protein n=1 Tax=Paenibacillus methanolicus TaxID=582686 RepID=A0A5S5CGY9_9BACL|nr:hypothetical protein [Paenibacillus methanolicus]TYP79049.1 hypothetical protein BCM02_101164 [Paenibacillus methanolicus]